MPHACPVLLEYALIDLTTKALFKNCLKVSLYLKTTGQFFYLFIQVCYTIILFIFIIFQETNCEIFHSPKFDVFTAFPDNNVQSSFMVCQRPSIKIFCEKFFQIQITRKFTFN